MDDLTKLNQDISEGKHLVSQFTLSFLENYILQGKSLKELEREYWVDISGFSIEDCRNALVDITRKYQIVLHYKGELEALLTAAENTRDNTYNNAYRSHMSALSSKLSLTKTISAKTHVEKLATTDIEKLNTSVAHLKIAVQFWKNVQKKLEFLQQSINMLIMANGVERKVNNFNNN